jgi:hypothetical protein
MKRTLWFPGNVKPVHVGAYEKLVGKDKGYQYWNGKFWGAWSTSPDMAFINKDTASGFQFEYWRGLEEKNQ